MITFDEACKIARNDFTRRGYVKLLSPAGVMGDSWLFLGKMFNENAPEYGNCPLKVSMSDGHAEQFSFSDPDHWDALDNIHEQVDVPNEYLKL